MTAIIAVPALGCDHRLYDAIVPFLPAGTELQSIVASQDSLAGCVSEVLAEISGRFVMLGTSFGGRVALELALAAPERVEGLVVIGAPAGPVSDPTIGQRRAARLRGGEFETVVAEMAAIISHRPGPNGLATAEAFIAMARDQGAEIMARQSDSLARRGDLWLRLQEIKCPALMLWGKHDQFSPASDGLRQSVTVARGRYVELAECGHFPTLEYPEETGAAITHWLDDNRLT